MTLASTLAIVAGAPAQKGVGQGEFAWFQVEHEDAAGMTYQVFSPKGVAKGRRYPLVFALHGNGQDAKSAVRNLASVSTAELPVFVIAPHYQQEAKFGAPVRPGAGAVFEKLLAKMIATRPIDPARVVLQGFSMGSNYSTAWLNQIATQRAAGDGKPADGKPADGKPADGNPAGATPAGEGDRPRLPFREVWLNGTAVPPRAPVRDVPFLLFVGEKETAVLGRINVVEGVRTAYRRMYTAGMDVIYLEIPGMGHSVNPDCHAIMRERLLQLPDYSRALPQKSDQEFQAVALRTQWGEFRAAFTALDLLIASEDRGLQGKARAARGSLLNFVKRHAVSASRSKRPTIDEYLEFARLSASLQERRELAQPLAAAAEKLARNPAVAAGIAAHARFTAAQRLAAEDWGKSVAAVQALADGELQGTFYGRRARAHLQALGEDYRAPLVGTEPGSEVPRKRRK